MGVREVIAYTFGGIMLMWVAWTTLQMGMDPSMDQLGRGLMATVASIIGLFGGLYLAKGLRPVAPYLAAAAKYAGLGLAFLVALPFRAKRGPAPKASVVKRVYDCVEDICADVVVTSLGAVLEIITPHGRVRITGSVSDVISKVRKLLDKVEKHLEV